MRAAEARVFAPCLSQLFKGGATYTFFMSLVEHLRGRAIFPSRYAWFLEGPWRRLLLSPKRLQRRLELSPALTVLEIGVGGGYYARPLSRLVRRLIALDLQLTMLNRLRHKPGGAGLVLIHGDATRLPLAGGSVDLVIAVTVLGEVSSPAATIAEVRRVLRPGGVFAVSEHWPDPDFVSFPRVTKLCNEGGLQIQARYGVRFNYTAIYRANAGLNLPPR